MIEQRLLTSIKGMLQHRKVNCNDKPLSKSGCMKQMTENKITKIVLLCFLLHVNNNFN